MYLQLSFCVCGKENIIFKEIVIPKPVTEGKGRKNPTGLNADACMHTLLTQYYFYRPITRLGLSDSRQKPEPRSVQEY